MEEEDSKRIISNCDKLVKEINWPEIWPKLFEHGIYSKENKKVQRWEKDLTDIVNTRDIYLTIIKRGPKAFENFLKCLNEIGRNDLSNILKPGNNSITVDQVDHNLEKEDDEIPQVIENGNRNRNNVNNNNNNNNHHRNVERNDQGESETQEEGGENDDYYKILQFTDTPLVIRVKKSTEFKKPKNPEKEVPFYVMRSKPRGLVLIINNTKFNGPELKDRAAAEHDEKNLKDLFQQMGFDVQTSGNLTKQQMLDEFERFSKQPELRRVHSMFVIVMSHGSEFKEDNISHSVVCGVDDKTIADTEILDLFTMTACENMFNKPKVFIFQSCRGDKVQLATNPSNVSMGRDDTDVNPFVLEEMKQRDSQARPKSDFLVAYATLPGYEALRDKLTGSWYIQTLCEVMMNHAHDTELHRMLQMVDQRLSTLRSKFRCQTSSIWNIGFNKKCYLNPGYFGDS